jgi:predicted HTH transcriptional regulator
MSGATALWKSRCRWCPAPSSAENYIAITRTSRATATRDLQDLVAKGALVRTGERKHTRYALALATSQAPRLGLGSGDPAGAR